jgi:hypothetical protein
MINMKSFICISLLALSVYSNDFTNLFHNFSVELDETYSKRGIKITFNTLEKCSIKGDLLSCKVNCVLDSRDEELTPNVQVEVIYCNNSSN